MTDTPGPASNGQSLRGELAAIEHEHPGWHPFLSDEGRIYITHIFTDGERRASLRDATGGTGDAVTLTPASVVLARHEIALWEHQHQAVAA